MGQIVIPENAQFADTQVLSWLQRVSNSGTSDAPAGELKYDGSLIQKGEDLAELHNCLSWREETRHP